MADQYINLYDSEGTQVGKKLYVPSSELITEEAEVAEIRRVRTILDRDWTAEEAILILKLLVKRLLKKAILP